VPGQKHEVLKTENVIKCCLVRIAITLGLLYT